MSKESNSSSPFTLLLSVGFKFVTTLKKKNYQTMPVLEKFPSSFYATYCTM